MKLNTERLIIKDVYSYDIPSCHYSILQNMGFDLSNIPKDDKLQRNIAIGLLMRSNPSFKILRDITESIMEQYLILNDVTQDDIIIRQYDGILLRRPLQYLPEKELSLKLQNMFTTLITTVDKDRYIAFDGNVVKIKGVPSRYEKMDQYLRQIAKINFTNISVIFKKLQDIKDEILFGEDIYDYCIPDGDNTSHVYFLKYGHAKINNSMIKLISHREIDKSIYFQEYIKPFSQAIAIEYV